jgi:hypothetical protein
VANTRTRVLSFVLIALAKRIKVEEGAFIPGGMNMPATALQVPSEFVTKWQEIVDLLHYSRSRRW